MYAILVDVTKCTGCERCVSACLDVNHMDRQLADTDRVMSRDGLSANRLLALDKVDDGRFARKSCMHCVDPSCVSACLVGGLTKSKEGPVVYDATMCIGCRYCMLACPFHIPRYEWDKTLPLVKKCDMCIDRLQQGQQPACVEVCPSNALLFGERDTMLKEAHNRISGNPDQYLDRVWGENEYGGTCVLYVSDVDLSKLGWSEKAPAGISSLTDPLIAKTPFIGVGVAATLLSVNWVIRRRMRLAVEQTSEHIANDDREQGEDI